MYALLACRAGEPQMAFEELVYASIDREREHRWSNGVASNLKILVLSKMGRCHDALDIIEAAMAEAAEEDAAPRRFNLSGASIAGAAKISFLEEPINALAKAVMEETDAESELAGRLTAMFTRLDGMGEIDSRKMEDILASPTAWKEIGPGGLKRRRSLVDTMRIKEDLGMNPRHRRSRDVAVQDARPFS